MPAFAAATGVSCWTENVCNRVDAWAGAERDSPVVRGFSVMGPGQRMQLHTGLGCLMAIPNGRILATSGLFWLGDDGVSR